MSPSNIEWTNETWNPTTGCSKVSPGCAHCYAETLTKRYAGANGWPATFLPWTPSNAAENVVIHRDRLDQPSRWKKPRMIFVNSMSDIFHEEIPDIWVEIIIDEMERADWHTYQVLTKRPERMRAILKAREQRKLNYANAFADSPTEEKRHSPAAKMARKRAEEGPAKHIWWGVTVENQRWADERIPILLDTPAAVRFLSCEPMLGPIDLGCDRWVRLTQVVRSDFGARMRTTLHPGIYRANTNVNGAISINTLGIKPNECERFPNLDWVIVGGESGSGHRPFDPAWARSIVAQCREAGVAAFVKQLGGARPGNKLEDLPEDLRVREFPR